MARKIAQLRRSVFFMFAVLTANTAVSQITSDGSLGTTVNQTGVVFDITGGTQVSSNLFHSFGIFDVNTGETASFQGSAGIANILSRVTGGSASNIDGTIQSTINGANLYLINPAGIVFGANASLDVQGSFHVTTADYISLGSDGRFDASMPANSILTASAPSAFGFVNTSPAPIEFNGSFLRTQNFATLSVIGGDITITDATLHAKEGRINIVSVASAGEVVPTASGLLTDSFTQLGAVNISHSTDEFGRPVSDNFGLPLGNIDVSGNGAGDVYIRSGSFYSDNGQVFSDTQRTGAAGSIDVKVRGELKLVNEARLISDAFFLGGEGSSIAVDAGTVVLESGGSISTVTTGSGNAGNIVVNASEGIFASGVSSSSDSRLQGNNRSRIGSETFGAGTGGRVEINTPILELSDQATLSARGTAGNGGDLLVNANRLSISDRAQISVSTFGAGNGGVLTLNAEELSITSLGTITSDSRGAGDAGSIVINVSGQVEISGGDLSDPLNPQHSQVRSNTFAQGNGGSIEINASRLVMTDQGLVQINLENQPRQGQPPVATDTQAGSIAISVDSIVIDGGAQIGSVNNSIGIGGEINVVVKESLQIAGSATNGQSSGLFNVTHSDGAAGNLQVSAGELRIENGATINTSTTAAGSAGQIGINVAGLDMNGGAVISSSTSGSGAGGEVRVNASEHITALGRSASGFATGFYSDVEIAPGASAVDASGSGGNIQLSAPVINLRDGATVSAKSIGVGNAGNINIDALSTVNLINGSSVTTSSSLSGGGRINLNAHDMLFLSDSAITSSVADGSGNGGDITIDPVFVILDSSQIIARADAGNGGNISITTDFLTASPDSVIDASSNTGIDGEVVIESPNDNLVASLAELPDSLLNANALLKQRCAARAAGTASSFVVTGPGGVPPQPGGLIYSSVPIGKTGLAAQLNGKPKQAFLLSCGKLPVNYL